MAQCDNKGPSDGPTLPGCKEPEKESSGRGVDAPLLVLMRTKRMVETGKVEETDPSTETPEGALSTP